MEEIRQTSSSTYETLANMDDASYIGSEIRLQKAPAWYGKHQTPNTGVFVLELIYLNCLATDFFHQHPLVSVKLWWLPWTYHWIWKGINNKTCGKFKRANIYFFASNVFFFYGFYFHSVKSAASFAPQNLKLGVFLCILEVSWDDLRFPTGKKHNQPHQRFQSGRSRDWGCILLRNSATWQWQQLNLLWLFKESIQRHPSFNVQRLLKKQIMWRQNPGKQKGCIRYVLYIIWLIWLCLQLLNMH